MKICGAIVSAAIFTSMINGQSAWAQFRDQSAKEAECKLAYLRNTDSSAARSYITRACNFMSLPNADSLLNRKERDYQQCILDAMPGTDADNNAIDLANACKTRAWDF